MIGQPTQSSYSQSLISGLRLRNFKSAAAADIDLGPLTILVGMNSSGKSSVLQAIRLVQQGTRDTTADGVFPLNSRLIRMGPITDVRTVQAAEDTEVGIGLDVSLSGLGTTVRWDIALGGVVPDDQASTFLRQVTVSIQSSEGHDTRIIVHCEPNVTQEECNEVWDLDNLQPEQNLVNPNKMVRGVLDVCNRNGRSQLEIATELGRLFPGYVIIEQPALAAVVAKQIDDVLSSQHVPEVFDLDGQWLWEVISNDANVTEDDDVPGIKDLWDYELEDNEKMCLVTQDRSALLIGRSVNEHVLNVDETDDLLHEQEVRLGDYGDCDDSCWVRSQLRLSWQVASTPEELATSLADVLDVYILRWSYGIDLDTLELSPLGLGMGPLRETGLFYDYMPSKNDMEEFGKSQLVFSFIDLVDDAIWERVALTSRLIQELADPHIRNRVVTQLTEQLKTRISNKTWTNHLPVSFKGRSMAIAHQIESDKTINHPWDSSDQEELHQTGKALERITEQVQYLGPLREEPKAANEATTHHPDSVGPRGENTVTVIRNHAQTPVTVPTPTKATPTKATPTTTTLIEALRAWVTHLGLVQDVETENLAALGLALKVKPTRDGIQTTPHLSRSRRQPTPPSAGPMPPLQTRKCHPPRTTRTPPPPSPTTTPHRLLHRHVKIRPPTHHRNPQRIHAVPPPQTNRRRPQRSTPRPRQGHIRRTRPHHRPQQLPQRRPHPIRQHDRMAQRLLRPSRRRRTPDHHRRTQKTQTEHSPAQLTADIATPGPRSERRYVT